ncbi:MAG: hypothetical protein IKV45_04330 [Firmicutes bacterium]|nr:hypothetical protein [Bacillota bacterium]
MKKNKMMRLASCLLVLVLMTSCVISGTFAKYTTSATADDEARVAYWGFQSDNSMTLEDLFSATYLNGVKTTVDSKNGVDVIAPGTSGSAEFSFAWDEAVSADGSSVSVTGPEVAYNFTVSVDGSVCDPRIANNTNIQWKLDNGTWVDWGTFLGQVIALSGDASGTKEYAPNTLPAAFTAADDTHTVYWQWVFSTSTEMDQRDTDLGNALANDSLAKVKLVITINATQID